MEPGIPSTEGVNVSQATAAHASSPSLPALDIRDLSFRYPGRLALDGVSLRVESGALFGILGPNGSGKTTLFSILTTLRRPSGGTAGVYGKSLSSDQAAVRKLLGVAFQKPALDVHLTCAENLHHHGRLYGMRRTEIRRRTDELLDRFELSERRNDKAKTLSGGLQRRLELARAMLHAPRLLLLDEPSTGLDPRARHQMWRDLTRLRTETGVTVVLTTHLMEEADQCDRLAIMNLGKVVEEGTPEALKAAVGGEIVYIESGDAASLSGEIEARFGLKSALVDGVLRIEEADAHKRVPELVEAFPGAVQSIRVARPTLEDVFLQSTGTAFNEIKPESAL